MKTWQQTLALVLGVTAFIPGQATPAQTNSPIPLATAPVVPATTTDASTAAEFPPGEGLRLAFRGERLEKVLAYLSQAAGFVVYLRPGVQVDGTINVWSEQPLSKEEAVNLLKTALHDHGCSVIQDGRTLTILRTEDMTRETPVRLGSDPAQISRSAEVVTQIIPVRTLNPVELVRLLTPLLPPGALLSHDESANALLLTAAESDIHRVAEIIAALDSVSASANTLRVFPLQYADAKILAGLIKELFAAPDTASRGTGAGARGNNFIRFPGAVGAAVGNPGRSAAATADDGQTPVSRVAAVADEHGNAVIVSAPDGLFPAIEKLVLSVDVEVQDVTAVEMFPLTNADPMEMADLLAKLFPEQNSSTDASSARIQFGGQGGRGAQTGGARQGNAAATGTASDRMQRMGRVLAVPDPRTSSLIVCAAKSLMPDIAALVKKLDAVDLNRVRLHVLNLRYADPYEVQRVLQELYPGSGTSSASAGNGDMLAIRQTTLGNDQLTSGPGSGTGASGVGRTSTGNRNQ